MSAEGPPDRGHAKGAIPLPVLLADRQEVVFVATPRDPESLRIPRRYWGTQVGVVAIPVSDEEVRGANLQPAADAGVWPRAVTRPDLLAPALSRLMGGEYVELSLQPGRTGLKATLLTEDKEQPFPVTHKDALGFLAAVFQNTPRGVIKSHGGRARRLILSVRPAVRGHEYRVRIAGVVETAPPASLADLGLSPSVLEAILDTLERRVGIFLVSGGPGSGRSTTLDLLALTLSSRGRAGGRIGARQEKAPKALPWLAASLGEWPFVETLKAAAPDFVLIERLEGPSDLVLAARLASSGCLVLAGAPAADPESLARTVAREIAAGSAAAIPLAILAQTIVRIPCRGCLRRATLPTGQARLLGFHRRDLEEFERQGGLALVRGEGCIDCARTGTLGVTGVQEFVDTHEGTPALPRLREEGWRKAVQGLACLEDVMTLPGAQRPMRTLREIQVHAGLPTSEPVGGDVVPRSQGGRSPVEETREPAPATPSEPALLESRSLAQILKDRTDPQADGGRLSAVVERLAVRASAVTRLEDILAPAQGFHLASHSVNAALLAARLWKGMGNDEDRRLIPLALLHDAGLLNAGIDPEADLPSTPSEEALDPHGARLRPEPILDRLGSEAKDLADPIRSVHSLIRFDLPSETERQAADLRAQVTALACLVDLHRHSSGRLGAMDLHDVTSLVMEQHGRRFGPALFRALLKVIPIFPIGCLVELSSGDLARVVSLNEDNHFRPRVEITVSAGREDLGTRRVIDLARAPFLHIRHRVGGSVPSLGIAV